MTRYLIPAVLASIAFVSPALADDPQPVSFTRDGITYTYTSTRDGDAVILEGTARPDGGKFRFVVRDGWVEGYANSVRVSFAAPKPVRESSVEVAQR